MSPTAEILYLAAPGAMYPNLNELPYKRVQQKRYGRYQLRLEKLFYVKL
jgi:microcystin degradation protein MlrC